MIGVETTLVGQQLTHSFPTSESILESALIELLSIQDNHLHDMVNKAREMEDTYGHYFDYTIVNTDLERTFDELRQTIDKLDSEAQWVPVSWIR